MHTVSINVAVIGAGTAGLSAYRNAKALGKTALLIEGGPYGTTCARVGCMPSKLLIAAAEAAHEARHTAGFGVHVDGVVRIDGKEVMARVKRERDRFVGFVLNGVESIPPQDRLRGYAHFVDDHTLQVDSHTLVHADCIVIATGSSPYIPEDFRVLEERLVVNDDVFAWDTLPGRVAVFGPGVIGLELGQALSRLGVDVKVFGHSGSIGGLTDPALRQYATDLFANEFYLDAAVKLLGIRKQDDGAYLQFVHRDGHEVEERFDYVLMATGRRPNVRHLALGNTSLQRDARGVPLFDPATLQCGTSSIFVAGDANAVLPLLHEAADEGKTAGVNAALFPNVVPGLRRAPIAVVFSDPQIMLVGRHFAQLDAARTVVGEVSFEDQGRSRVMLKNKGLMHVYADKLTGHFLGAEMIGPRAENIAHLLAWSYQQELTITQMLEMPFYHPVVEEGLRTALRDAAAKL